MNRMMKHMFIVCAQSTAVHYSIHFHCLFCMLSADLVRFIKGRELVALHETIFWVLLITCRRLGYLIIMPIWIWMLSPIRVKSKVLSWVLSLTFLWCGIERINVGFAVFFLPWERLVPGEELSVLITTGHPVNTQVFHSSHIILKHVLSKQQKYQCDQI